MAILEEVLGPEQAATLMAHLPPVGWADVATKRGLDALEERIEDRLGASINTLRAELAGSIAELDQRMTARIASIEQQMATRAQLAAMGARMERHLRVTAAAVVAALSGVIGLVGSLSASA